MSDPLRHHHEHRAGPAFGTGLAGRIADKIAEGIGTVQFLLGALVLIAVWIILNGGYAFFSHALTAIRAGRPFDPAPWILLNLIFSFEAFFTGSLVVIAAKAQAKRDRLREEADARHREELAERQLQELKVNTELTERIRDLTEQVHRLVCRTDSPGEA